MSTIDVTHMTPWPLDQVDVKVVAFADGKKETIFEAQDKVSMDDAEAICKDPMGVVRDADPNVALKARRAFAVIEGTGRNKVGREQFSASPRERSPERNLEDLPEQGGEPPPTDAV